MEEIKLDVQVRNEVGSRKVKILRRNDSLPGIVYGGSHKPTSVRIDRRAYERIRRAHHGESIVLHLNVMEGNKKLRDYSTIVKEEQCDPVTEKILHVDFKRISLKQKIEVKVSCVAKGEPVGVKRDGGSLEHQLWELDVVCLPTHIPAHIEIDVSLLGIGGTIHVKDIILPDGVITKHDPESIIFSVSPPKKEEVAEQPAEEAEPEVIKEKKEEAPKKDAGQGDAKKEG